MKYFYSVDEYSIEYEAPSELWEFLRSHGLSFYEWAKEFTKLIIAALQVGDYETVDEQVQFMKDAADRYRAEWRVPSID